MKQNSKNTLKNSNVTDLEYERKLRKVLKQSTKIDDLQRAGKPVPPHLTYSEILAQGKPQKGGLKQLALEEEMENP